MAFACFAMLLQSYPATTLAGYLLSGLPPVVFVVLHVSVCRVGFKIV